MPDLIDRRNLSFVLYELEEIEHLTRYPRFAEHSRETFEAAIDTAHAIAVDKFAPHNRKGDLEEPRLVDGRVEMIPEVREALQAYSESGFTAMELDFEAGGMQLPGPVALACSSLFQIANIATTAYAGLSHGVAAMLAAHGSEEQKRRYMDPINEGRFFGTMCLSEPHAGSSLADIRTRAEPADGHYLLTGSKMWISGGDHELAENIIEMVLAKIPGGPPGVKGISLFIVPKYLVNEDGTLGERNDIQLAGLNHKMGYRGTTNTFLKLGERGHCVGYLVGEPHKGLSYMFHMMNGARIGVGMGATALGYAGYLHSLEYARERPQGRHPDQKDPAAPPVPIIGHADVRRMLLQQKCYVEGAYALAMYCSSLELRGRHEEDAATRGEAGLLLDVLTPVMKAWPSAWCLKANELAIQVLGGYGYTRDYPVEQYYRDNRLNPIHEGTNGIQALDLLGRKMQMQGGAGLSLLSREMQATIDAALAEPALQEHAKALAGALEALRRTTGGIRATLASGHVRAGLANAHAYLEMAGHIIIAWMWLRQALVAARAVDAARGADKSFYRGKLQACRFFFRHELPIVHTHAALIDSGDRTTLDMAPEWF